MTDTSLLPTLLQTSIATPAMHLLALPLLIGFTVLIERTALLQPALRMARRAGRTPR